MKLGMYILTPESLSTAYFPSVCVPVCASILSLLRNGSVTKGLPRQRIHA
jgi:hypothetical protein